MKHGYYAQVAATMGYDLRLYDPKTQRARWNGAVPSASDWDTIILEGRKRAAKVAVALAYKCSASQGQPPEMLVLSGCELSPAQQKQVQQHWQDIDACQTAADLEQYMQTWPQFWRD